MSNRRTRDEIDNRFPLEVFSPRLSHALKMSLGDKPIQGTPEWDAARLGKATASRMADICATVKGGWAASRKNYATELVLERITARKAENGFKSAVMERGNDIEEEARAAYLRQLSHPDRRRP